MQKLTTILSVLVLCAALSAAQPQSQPVRRANAEHRVALVIGNKDYKNSPLRSPVNDAQDMAQSLKLLDFDVTLHTNLNQKAMKAAIHAFGDKLRKGGIGLFYYSGHGVQVSGKNYLMPIETNIRGAAEIEIEAVDVQSVFAQMTEAKNRLNIVILDACRNAPFPSSVRNLSRGLASTTAPSGTLIAYSTAPGSVANDGTGRNSPYTRALLKHINTPCLEAEAIFRNVRNEVLKLTVQTQQPWESTSLTGKFYFNPNPDCSAPAVVTGNDSTTIAFASPEPAMTAAAAGMLVRTLEAPDEVRSVAVSPDGKIIAALCANNEVSLWDATDGRVIWVRPRPGRGKALSVTFSTDGKSILCAYSDEIVFWDVSTGIIQRTISIIDKILAINIRLQIHYADYVTFSDDRKLFATKHAYEAFRGSVNNCVVVWNTESGEPMFRLANPTTIHETWDSLPSISKAASYTPIHSLAFEHNGKHLICNNADRTVTTWKLATAAAVQTSTLIDCSAKNSFSDDNASSISISASGQSIALTNKDCVFVINGNGKILKTITDLTNQVESLCYAPNEKILATADNAGQIAIWLNPQGVTDELKRQLLQHKIPPQSVGLQGAMLYRGPKLTFDIDNTTPALQEVSLAFSPDSRTLISGGRDKRVLIWDLQLLYDSMR